MSVVATVISAIIFLQAGSLPAQLPFHVAQAKMKAKNPPATNGDDSREKGVPESTKVMQDGSFLDKAIEVAENRVMGKATSFKAA